MSFSTSRYIIIVLLMLPQIFCSWQIYTHVQSFPFRQYLNVVLMLLPRILSHTCCTFGRTRPHFRIGDNFELWDNFDTTFGLLYHCCSFRILVTPAVSSEDLDLAFILETTLVELLDNFDTTFGPDIDSFVTIGKFCTTVAPLKSWSDNTCCLFGRPRPHFHIVGKETGWC